ncbi:RNA-directed DNA polymerase (Reverse transcriptase), Ribonuclease H-like protein [Gossypium australe]|uniref:RNA-directed DNA polymerase (Reverse transcriptase), Ribonuclease H-like protein n=1 Tax=Gossypium australe TaxID=47621 RepID=A0A5B6UXR8_9ROSI|nr:RNA-directed DNA polymerase (Reverse transcriptase), Ribonuclease H-like protein [Gossypium australe]
MPYTRKELNKETAWAFLLLDSFVLSTFLCAYHKSLDISDMSNDITDSEFPFERDMGLEESQNFEGDRDYDLPPNFASPSIREECKPAQQKLRRMRPDVVLKIKEEVKKQFDAGFLQVVKYSDPKDNFPLPHIDTLVDNTMGYSLFSFMDCFSGYNHMKMHPEDMEKTIFITLWGTFCYKVMPFGLKNVGATYQRATVTLFHDMMHKEIKVYVDDMITKSRTEKKHIEVLKKLFLRMRKFQLKLNPAKCTFGARSGKLLGFVVSQRGIEVDSDKKHNQGVWGDECQKAFDKVKQYLSNAPSIALNGRMARWQILLSEFDIVYVNQKAIKGSAIVEVLASRALEDYEPLSFDFLNEELMYVATNAEYPWKLNFDEA